MKKRLIILACVLALAACEVSRPPFEIDAERYRGVLDRGAESPGTLIRKRAIDVYENQYFRAGDHRAIAQARNGTWSWTHDQPSPEAAMDDALAKCRDRNGERESDEPCQVVNVNGFWIADVSTR